MISGPAPQPRCSVRAHLAREEDTERQDYHPALDMDLFTINTRDIRVRCLLCLCLELGTSMLLLRSRTILLVHWRLCSCSGFQGCDCWCYGYSGGYYVLESWTWLDYLCRCLMPRCSGGLAFVFMLTPYTMYKYVPRNWRWSRYESSCKEWFRGCQSVSWWFDIYMTDLDAPATYIRIHGSTNTENITGRKVFLYLSYLGIKFG